MKQLFKIRIKNPHPSCVIYESTCVSTETYIGETRRNAIIRRDGHEDPKKESERGKNFMKDPNHLFSWKILLPAAANNHVTKFTEASMIALNRPILNEQVESHSLLLF